MLFRSIWREKSFPDFPFSELRTWNDLLFAFFTAQQIIICFLVFKREQLNLLFDFYIVVVKEVLNEKKIILKKQYFYLEI